MPVLTLSNEQVVELVKQLPAQQKLEVFEFLLLQQWEKWESLSRYGAEKAVAIARERGLDWNAMSEEEREAFIDDIVHEN